MNIHQQPQERMALQGKFFFAWKLLKIAFEEWEMRNFTHRWPQSGDFVPKIGHFFLISEKMQERPPPPSSKIQKFQQQKLVFIACSACKQNLRASLIWGKELEVFLFMFKWLFICHFMICVIIQWQINEINIAFVSLGKFKDKWYRF